MESRLNILLTHRQPERQERAAAAQYLEDQPWYQLLSHLLMPLGVRTFEATTGPQALSLIEQHPIHLAVVDTRLSDTDRLTTLRLIEKIRERAQQPDFTPPEAPPAGNIPTQSYRVQVRFQDPGQPAQQRIEVRFERQPSAPPRGPVYPTVILVTPTRDDELLPEAMKSGAFSVVHEPVDVNLMLEVMARAMRRFHRNLWPQ